MIVSSLPALGPRFLEELWRYLLFRDHAPPSALPQPRIITSTVLVTVDGTDLECDRVTWDYDQPRAGRGVPADGFIIWFNAGESLASTPVNGFKLSIQSRGFEAVWPTGVARSYAVAAYRNTYQGEQMTARVADDTWTNVT